ncbi:hypothetical protein PMAYCL1PPCAC_26165, partial [Pristionchus mayeri]
SCTMIANYSMRYGFNLDEDYFIDFSMKFQSYAPLVATLTIHPIMLYILIFENKLMKSDIRSLYVATHLSLVLNEWIFSIALRIYPVVPFGALYCEGPLCRSGINKQILLVLLSIPAILISSPFFPLSARMHQMFVPPDSKWELRLRTQIILAILLNVILVANVIGFGVFGKDHDDIERLMQLPELSWLSERGGTIFLFGPPGDPQYFKW